jgi:hypothetical protein
MTGMTAHWTKSDRGMRGSERSARRDPQRLSNLTPADAEAEGVDESTRRALEAEIEEACSTYDVWRAAVLCEGLAVLREARRPRPVVVGASTVRSLA